MNFSYINEEIDREYEDITALPRWESVHNPTHMRQGSREPILIKDIFVKEAMMTPNRSGTTTPTEDESPRHSRMMIWLVLMVVILLALAVVLGAVLGTFVNPGRHFSPTSPSVTDTPAGPTPNGRKTPPSATPHIESLAVTGWSIDGPSGYYTVWLFSQDTKGYLSRSTFNSSTGNWTRVSNFAAAKHGTPLAAAALNAKYYANRPNYSFPGIHYQAEVVYLDEFNYVSEWVFAENGPAIGLPGSLVKQKYMAYDKSDIAFYWPKLFFQGIGGELRGVHFECHRKDECWQDTVLRTTEPTNGTRLAMAPLKDGQSSTALFYEESDCTLVIYEEDNGQPSEIWANRAFSDLIPANSSVTAFSTTRPTSNNDAELNTYLLWQDTNGTVLMSWTDSDEGWKGPVTSPAFAGAHKSTRVACLTGLTFPNFPLRAGNELSRCYFRAGSAIREVSFDGESWDVVGNVPIDV